MTPCSMVSTVYAVPPSFSCSFCHSSPDILSEAIVKLMKDEELRKRMGENAKRVVETYSEERVMKKWIDLYEETVAD